MENARIKFYVEKSSFWPQAAIVMLVMASAFQFVSCWGVWTDRMQFLLQMALPILSFLCFALLLMLLGKHALWLTFIPFLSGVLFYALEAWFNDNHLLMIIGLAYCVVAVVLYLGTVFSIIRTKWLLVFLFALPFLYRAFYRDVLILQQAGDSVSFAAGMKEMSLLSVLLAMTFTAIGMRKRVKERRHKASEAYEIAGKEPVPAAASQQPPTPVPPASELPFPPAPNAVPLDPDADGGSTEN